MKILPKVLRNLPNFWNKTHKNKPDWQQFVHFRKSQKVVNHSTLTLNSQVGMVWADCYNHQPTTIHLGRVLSVTNQSYESAAFSIPQPCGIQYRVTHIHTHCTGWIPNIFYAFLNILKSWTILLECMNTVL